MELAAIRPMLATAIDRPFRREGWSFELKWDGFRTLAYLHEGRVTLVSRNGHIANGWYPELANLHGHCHVPAGGMLILDGEVVALDEHGRPSFQRLQQRLGFHAGRLDASQVPVTFVVFDLLWRGGADGSLLEEPLGCRQARLREAVAEGAPIVLSRTYGEDGVPLFELARRLGLEGIIGKRLASRYQPGRRSPDWLKVKIVHTQDTVIVGWSPGSQAQGFGSLLLGVVDEGRLRYAGKVGSGFDAAKIAALLPLLRDRATDAPPLPAPGELRAACWVRPELVAEVAYTEWTHEGQLRHPAFRGLRDDKDPAECVLER